jgi:hypothetical protein
LAETRSGVDDIKGRAAGIGRRRRSHDGEGVGRVEVFDNFENGAPAEPFWCLCRNRRTAALDFVQPVADVATHLFGECGQLSTARILSSISTPVQGELRVLQDRGCGRQARALQRLRVLVTLLHYGY